MGRPEFLTFDCYGTLIDWNSGIVAALSAEAEAQGRDADAGTILAAYHAAEPRIQAESYRTYREILTLLEAEIACELRWDPPGRPGYLADSVPSWPAFADTNVALGRLAARGFRLGILSNIDDDLLSATRRRLDVDFSLLVTAQQLRSYKPAAPHFERAMQAVDGDRSRLLHVAQSYFHDIRPAGGMNIRTVWVNRLAEPLPDAGPAPTAEVADLTAFVDWIEARFV